MAAKIALTANAVYLPTILILNQNDGVAGAIKSDAGVQGLPCDGVCKQGKPCTPGIISSIAEFVCIIFNRTLVWSVIPAGIDDFVFLRYDASH